MPEPLHRAHQSNLMQTFLPYANFRKSAETLDYRRLGKQRSECKQIMRALVAGGGWRHHRATRMWAGFVPALCLYYNEIIREWKSRGYRNNMPLIELGGTKIEMPYWLGWEKFHSRMRARLLGKDFAHYSKLGWTEDPIPDGDPRGYIWPV